MIQIYTKNNCAFCIQAKNLLKSKNIDFEEINIELDPDAREFMLKNNHRTIPQIYYQGKLFVEGGYTGLSRMSDEDIKNKLKEQNANQ
jgi:glutaredoxin 3